MAAFDITTVVEARPIGESRLWLRFSDGVEGALDLGRDTRASRFAELNDPDYFAQVRLFGGGVGWPNGYDCAPEWLYDRVVAGIEPGARRNDDEWESIHRQVGAMPEISRFFGIVIKMYFDDHTKPHFHAEFGEHVISIEIEGEGVRGSFPPARLPMLFEWRDRHRAELLANWGRLQRGEPALPIKPLG